MYCCTQGGVSPLADRGPAGATALGNGRRLRARLAGGRHPWRSHCAAALSAMTILVHHPHHAASPARSSGGPAETERPPAVSWGHAWPAAPRAERSMPRSPPRAAVLPRLGPRLDRGALTTARPRRNDTQVACAGRGQAAVGAAARPRRSDARRRSGAARGHLTGATPRATRGQPDRRAPPTIPHAVVPPKQGRRRAEELRWQS